MTWENQRYGVKGQRKKTTFTGVKTMINGQELVSILIYLAIWGCILYVLWWALGKLALGEPWTKIGTVALVILTVVVLLNLLLGFVGTPLVSWRR